MSDKDQNIILASIGLMKEIIEALSFRSCGDREDREDQAD